MQPVVPSPEAPQSSGNGPTMSRRTVLKLAAAGASAGAMGSSLSGGADPQSAAAIPAWTIADMPPQQGRRAIVTGANGFPEGGRSGLGYHGALALARSGADVTIASRNRARGEEAVRRIRLAAPASRIRFEELDLASLGSVKAFCQRIEASGPRVDLLINNAGVMGRLQRETSVNGHERVFATNTLGHFVLTTRLLPLLQNGREARVIWVSSLRAADHELRWTDLQSQRHYDYAAAYNRSKLANLLLARELARRSENSGWNIASIAAHPGVARTNIILDGPGLDSREGWRFRALPFLFQPAAQGVLPILYTATAPAAQQGGYYGPKGFGGMRGLPGSADMPANALDQGASRILWRLLEELGRIGSYGD